MECGRSSTSALPGLQSPFMMTVQLCQTCSSAISSTSTLNYAVVSKYGKALIWKINASIWFQHKEEIEGTEGAAHLSESQKAHPTSEVTIVA